MAMFFMDHDEPKRSGRDVPRLAVAALRLLATAAAGS
jgi:hypothetical protein